MYRIALHEASNQRRWWTRHKKQELTIDSPLSAAAVEDGDDALCLGATLSDSSVSPYQQAENAELRARVEASLRKLPEAFRTVVVLREMEGFSYDEIAEILDVPQRHHQEPPHPRTRRPQADPRRRRARPPAGNAGPQRRCTVNPNFAPTLPPSCLEARNRFSEYLDGATSGRVMQSVAAHLEVCPACAGEFAEWRAMQQVLAAAAAVKTPDDLGLKLRVAISHERQRSQTRRHNLATRWENFLRPALVQVASGLAGALVLIGGMAALVGTLAVPQSVLANDVPLGAVTMPHFLYSAAQTEPVITRGDTTIVVEGRHQRRGPGLRLAHPLRARRSPDPLRHRQSAHPAGL